MFSKQRNYFCRVVTFGNSRCNTLNKVVSIFCGATKFCCVIINDLPFLVGATLRSRGERAEFSFSINGIPFLGGTTWPCGLIYLEKIFCHLNHLGNNGEAVGTTRDERAG